MAWYQPGHGRPIKTVVRLLLVAWGVFLLAGFSLAVSLAPNPAGFGTHQQLGLPPCSFQTMFGIPCPSCGMTTSFSHFVRGQWLRAAAANLGGLLLAILLLSITWIVPALSTGDVEEEGTVSGQISSTEDDGDTTDSIITDLGDDQIATPDDQATTEDGLEIVEN